MNEIIVVGAGFAGSVCSRILADAGFRVLIVEKRDHVAGNAFDYLDADGILVHKYGPHIFHTNSKRIFEYLSRFTDWRFYEHRVLALVDGQLYPIPINQTTISRMYGTSPNEAAIESFFEKVRVPCDKITTSEDVVLSSVGYELCEKFFRGYTLKQWGLDLSELSAGVAARIPTRVNDDDRYFTDSFQFMPSRGYTQLFQRMLDHPRIAINLGTDYFECPHEMQCHHLIYTGPIDRFYDYRFGPLPYRSLRFEFQHFSDIESFQPVAQVNYPNDFEYTRITEFKKLTGQVHDGTSIAREYSQPVGEPFYPIPTQSNEILFKRYQQLADNEHSVTFVGRLAQYRYFNMDQAVAAAMLAAETLITKFRKNK